MIELERKLKEKEEELKSNEIKLMARNERFERVQVEVGLLKGELAKLHSNNKSLQDQLGEAKAEATKAVSEYQSSTEMAALKQTIRNEAIEKAVEFFVYTMTT